MTVRFCKECGHNVKMPHWCPNKKPKDDPLPPQKLYAFWKYDLPPYMLGGVIERFAESGRVKVKGYGGMFFTPIAIIPDRAGAEALEKLKALRQSYDKQEKALKKKFKRLALKNVNLEGD